MPIPLGTREDHFQSTWLVRDNLDWAFRLTFRKQVVIQRATFVDALALLFVSATSAEAPEAELFVTVPNCLTNAPTRRIGKRYVFLQAVQACGSLNGQTATVTSSLGGSDTATVR
jgi:hypothetical protein